MSLGSIGHKFLITILIIQAELVSFTELHSLLLRNEFININNF
jgi:hypothetical protein